MKKITLLFLMVASAVSCFAQKDSAAANTCAMITINGMPSGSTIPKDILMTVAGIELKDSTKCNRRIMSFNFTHKKDGRSKTYGATGTHFVSLMLTALKELKPGETFYIENICVQDTKKKKVVKGFPSAKFTVGD